MSNLNGKKYINKYSLSGNDSSKFNSQEFQNIKISCIDTFILPLYGENWDSPLKNQFLLEIFKEKLTKIQLFFKNEEVNNYVDLISLLQLLLPIYEKWNNAETKKSDGKEIISMMYTTTMIKLKPEYELYHQLIGKPNRLLKQNYNESILLKIKRWMKEKNITFEKMKQKMKLN